MSLASGKNERCQRSIAFPVLSGYFSKGLELPGRRLDAPQHCLGESELGDPDEITRDACRAASRIPLTLDLSLRRVAEEPGVNLARM